MKFSNHIFLSWPYIYKKYLFTDNEKHGFGTLFHTQKTRVCQVFLFPYIWPLLFWLQHLDNFLCSFSALALLVYNSTNNINLEEEDIRRKLISNNQSMEDGYQLHTVDVDPVGK